MKRYIVTDDEMRARDKAAIELALATVPGTDRSFMQASMDFDEAQLVTYRRPIQEWATHFAAMKMESTSVGMQPWYYRHEEIPK